MDKCTPEQKAVEERTEQRQADKGRTKKLIGAIAVGRPFYCRVPRVAFFAGVKDEIKEQCRDFWVEDGARLPNFVYLEVRKQRAAAAAVAPPVESHIPNAGIAANRGNEQAAPPAYT